MRATILTLMALLCMPLQALAAALPTVTNAADGIFAAFRTHPLVGLGEWHNWAQEYDFYASLIRDPRFARDVGNILLEVGDAAQQKTADRYVNGENVPYVELRKVWGDTVGFFPAVTAMGSMNVYAVIRDVNMKLPRENRIKVWLGDPPIDWSKIKTKRDWEPLEAERDSYPADLIVREILSKNKKALMIYGIYHFGVIPGNNNIRARIDATHPGALFVVSPFAGYTRKDCGLWFEKLRRGLHGPLLLAPVQGSSLENDLYRPGCEAYARPREMTEAQFEVENRSELGLNSDALLYLVPRNQMLRGPMSPDIYLDLDYRAELARRYLLRTGQKLEGFTPADNLATSESFWKNWPNG